MTYQPREEIDRFAAEMQQAMRETYRKVTKPKDAAIRVLWTINIMLALCSIVQALYIWNIS